MILTVFEAFLAKKSLKDMASKLATENTRVSRWKEPNTTPLKIKMSNRNLFSEHFQVVVFGGLLIILLCFFKQQYSTIFYTTLPVNKHRV